jgi:hypothetical protein
MLYRYLWPTCILLGAGIALAAFFAVYNLFLGIVSQQVDKIQGFHQSTFSTMRDYINANLPSVNWDFNVVLLFFAVPSLAGFLAGYQTRRIGQGVVIGFWTLVIGTAIWSIGLMIINYAFWGSHQWHFFWKNDGAIDDFLRSGATNLHLFILQDMQGALFFHPLLSAFLGALCGLAGGGVARSVLLIQGIFSSRATASAPRHEDSY